MTERLSCYDAAVGGAGGLGARYQVPAATGGHSPESEAAWRLQHNANPFSEADRSAVQLRATAIGGDAEGRAVQSLEANCDGLGGRHVAVSAIGYVGVPGQRLALRYRYGEGEIVQEEWMVGRRGTSVSMPSEGSIFLEGLRSGEELLLEVQTYRGQRIWARFPADPAGREVLDHVLGGCRDREAFLQVSAAQRPGGL